VSVIGAPVKTSPLGPLVEEVNLGVHAPTLEDDADAHLAVHVTR